MKVFIIGGGASGMMAALTAAGRSNCHVTLLERQNRVGRKLLATGNGRCNLTNRYAAPEHYHSETPEYIARVLGRFSPEQALQRFRELGLYAVEEENGKYYPLSDQANSVVDVLRFSLEQAGVEIITSCDVLSLSKKARGYRIETTTGEFFADKVIVSAGGCAGKSLGGTKSGYRLLEGLGHTVTGLYPALVQIKTDTTYVRALKGVRAAAAMILKSGGRILGESSGEVQFTDFGISGPAAFELSRAVSVQKEDKLLLLDFMPDYPQEALAENLRERAKRFPDLTCEHIFTGMVNTRLGQTLVKYSGTELHRAVSSLTEEEFTALAHTVKFFAVKAEGVLGMDHAQVTAGGIPLSQVKTDTLESKKAPGVFITGELLDADGDCGGYNLQWAWATGFIAGHLGETEAKHDSHS